MINGVLLYKNNTPSGLIISGNVYNDQNASTGGVDNPVLVGKDNIPTGLKVLLIDTNTQLILQIVNVVSIGNYGTFAFAPVPAAVDYDVRITSATLTIGTTAPVSSVLPTYWEITGETAGGFGDGLPNGVIEIPSIDANTTVNFGIRIINDGVIKKIYYSTPLSANAQDVIDNVIGSPTNLNDIYGEFDIGTTSVIISHTRMGSFLQETITVNSTTFTTFWNDIRNWIYANNLFDFTNVLNQQEIQDYTNRTYMSVKQG